MSRRWRGPGLLLLALLVTAAGAPPAAGQTAADVRARVEAGVGPRGPADESASPAPLQDFYERRGYEPAWLRGGRAVPTAPAAARAVVDGLRAGFLLDPAHRAALDRLAAPATRRLGASAAAETDVRMTEAVLAYAAFLQRGVVDPRRLHRRWGVPARTDDVGAVVERGLAAGDVPAALATLVPQPDYQRLAAELDRYDAIARAGGWAPLPPDETLRPGDQGPAVADLRARLAATGDAPPAAEHADRFDDALEAAVRAVQRRHGLVDDGVVGRQTRAALDVPAAARVRQLQLALERLRWGPVDGTEPYVLVNVAGYELRVVEGGAAVLELPVIVGRPRTPTPLFGAVLTEVVLAPYWHIPASIARNEVFPKARQDRTYLARHHIRVLSGGRLRQDPGPSNPLGRVKFTIANPDGIGLHDTPERHLFARPARAFSHGCIRVGQPMELAMYVLRGDTSWTRERLDAVVDAWAERHLPVPQPLPVYVVYRTAWVDDEGRLQLRPDVYGHDARLDRLLTAAGR